MKTKHSHELTPNSIRADHSWGGELTLVATETVGDEVHEVTLNLTPALLKSLVQKSGRNALIDAKVIRGKKNW